VVNIGHGVAEIGRAMAEQSSQIAFAHTSQFHPLRQRNLPPVFYNLRLQMFRMVAAFTSRPAARKLPKLPSSLRGNIIWSPGSRSVME